MLYFFFYEISYIGATNEFRITNEFQHFERDYLYY